MSAQTVIDKIEQKAREAANATLEEGKANAKKVYDDIIGDAKRRADDIKKKAVENADLLGKGRRQSDNQSKNLALLKAKKEALEDVKTEVRNLLINISEEDFVRIFSKHIALSDLSGEYTVIPSKEHKAIIKKTQKKLEKATSLTLVLDENDADIVGGFILSCPTYDVDFSLDSIIESVFLENEKDIADILFKKGDV